MKQTILEKFFTKVFIKIYGGIKYEKSRTRRII